MNEQNQQFRGDTSLPNCLGERAPPSRPVTGVLGTLLLGRAQTRCPSTAPAGPTSALPGVRPRVSPVPRGVPRAPKCASPQRQQVEPPASPQTVWAAKGELEAHPDPGVAWPGLAQPARSTQPGPQLQARPTAPGAARVLAALVGVLSVQLLRLHELLQRLVDALSGLRGEQRPRHTHCHVSADRDRDSRVSFHVKRTAFVMKFTVTRVHANDVLPLRKEQVEANRTT